MDQMLIFGPNWAQNTILPNLYLEKDGVSKAGALEFAKRFCVFREGGL